jgi:predicted nucleic acid-binding protein
VIVADASAIIELLLQTEVGSRVEDRLRGIGADLHAPHLLDVEIANGLRRLVRRREVLPERAELALETLALLRIIRHPHLPLVNRVWKLRDNFTAYDAVYLALAESLDAVVVTCDARFGAAPSLPTRIEVIH